MGKKIKLNLGDLTIRSFVTSLDTPEERKVMGGSVAYTDCDPTMCNTMCDWTEGPFCTIICDTVGDCTATEDPGCRPRTE